MVAAREFDSLKKGNDRTMRIGVEVYINNLNINNIPISPKGSHKSV